MYAYMGGNVDAVVVAAGSGGTAAGANTAEVAATITSNTTPTAPPM